jgi:DNA polymerase-4
MTVSLTRLTAYAEQVSLFDEQSIDEQRRHERAKRLAVALDTLHDKFGKDAIRYGRSH